MINWPEIQEALRPAGDPVSTGTITRAVGTVVECQMPGLKVGAVVEVLARDGREPLLAEVVGVREDRAVLMPVGDMRGIEIGSKVRSVAGEVQVGVGDGFIGRVVDAFGRPLDGKGPIRIQRRVSLHPAPINPLARPPIRERLSIGIRAIDAAVTCGRGQRVAIMAGSGVGKSVLLGMVARQSEADVIVLALIGERGREVREFIENTLGEEGLRRAVVVCATSDTPPLQRIRAAHFANAITEYFRETGKDALLLMDSMTRIAMAQREVGLAAGEPPTSRGYTPSCFALLPKILERAGTLQNAGSFTGLYTVLTEGDDLQDPIADAVRATVDGHIVLSRTLTDRGQYPPVDVLRSTSRLMPHVVSEAHQLLAVHMRRLLAAYEEAEDLINLGAYVTGANPVIDEAIDRVDSMRAFLSQGMYEAAAWTDTHAALAQLFASSTAMEQAA